jgi:hypothetical protein
MFNLSPAPRPVKPVARFRSAGDHAANEPGHLEAHQDDLAFLSPVLGGEGRVRERAS